MTEYAVLPPRIEPRLPGAPRVRQMYWCEFPSDARLPEMWKCRPVIVLSRKARYHGTVTVVPVTTKDQSHNPHAFRLTTTMGSNAAWALAEHLTTVAVSRLRPNKKGQVRLPPEEFDGVMRTVLGYLPSLLEPEHEEETSTYRSP